MNISEILGRVDNTLLSPVATFAEIQALCDDAVKYKTASVCIAPAFVRRASEYLAGKVPVCTVVGFPNGYNSTEVKVFEAIDAIKNGANEIDMVVNLGWVKEGRFDLVLDEIMRLRAACGRRILKVIVETCVLTEAEKIKMCEIVAQSGADFIKTSTGFSSAGATFDDVQLFAAHVGPNLKIKAAGGISSIADAERFIELGAQRLGTSRIVKIVKELELR